MNIIIFGATGKLGQKIIESAIEASYNITAFARNPDDLSFKHKNFQAVHGDIYRPGSVEKALRDHDVIISALGITGRTTKTICEDGVRVIASSMKKHHIKKL